MTTASRLVPGQEAAATRVVETRYEVRSYLDPDDPRVRERIDHLILYTRHAELYYAHANGGAPKEDVAAHSAQLKDIPPQER